MPVAAHLINNSIFPAYWKDTDPLGGFDRRHLLVHDLIIGIERINRGHLQTAYVVSGNFTNVDKVVYERVLLRVPDGGTL